MGTTDRNALIERYGQGAAALRRAWSEVPAEAWTWRPAPDAWSAHEIVIHCADSETYAATRIRLLVAEPEPLIVGYDQEQWVDVFGYHNLPVEPAFAAIEAVRLHTHSLIRNLPETAWTRVGTHTESGPYTATDWLETYGVHLHDHAAQIRANIEQWNAASR